KPEAMPSWLFRALIWPVWAAGGANALFAWRWLTTLACVALGWATARRLGARGAAPLPALLLCAMVYRGRTMVRAEALTMPLFGAALVLLEWRRAGGRLRVGERAIDPAWLLAPIAWVWVDAHISYWLVFFTAALYGLDALAGEGARRGGRPGFGPLAVATLAAAGVCFLNPFRWRPVWAPVGYFFFWRHQPLYPLIG